MNAKNIHFYYHSSGFWVDENEWKVNEKDLNKYITQSLYF